MELFGRYQDGVTATVHEVICGMEGAGEATTIVIVAAGTHRELARWPARDIYPLHARRDELRIGVVGKPAGARLFFAGRRDSSRARALLPTLAEKSRRDRGRQLRLLGLSTAALASLLVAYLFGVPLLAGRIAAIVPPQWERDLGVAVAGQLADLLGENGRLALCDPDPDSTANRAIARFADLAIEGTGTPFDVTVTIVRHDLPNAFTLPGGQVFYFSALIEGAQSPDEFAGVLSHEIGHVVYRHSMETLIASAGTGLLIGFVLGDMYGFSVAGALGTALVDSSFSREAERVADAFTASVASRAGFRPAALADLLDRVAADDDYSRMTALLSTHPLTAERRVALEALPVASTAPAPAFSAEEWQAIRGMCDQPAKVTDDLAAFRETFSDPPVVILPP